MVLDVGLYPGLAISGLNSRLCFSMCARISFVFLFFPKAGLGDILILTRGLRKDRVHLGGLGLGLCGSNLSPGSIG